jgi:hypothetical protein
MASVFDSIGENVQDLLSFWPGLERGDEQIHSAIAIQVVRDDVA